MDPISDMLIKIKNAQAAKKPSVSFGYSKLKLEISKLLERKGFLKEVDRKGRKNKKLIEAVLIYNEAGESRINNVKRISKPSKRVYRSFKEIYSVKNGLGVAVYSTPDGLMTNSEAVKQHRGGEILFEIW